MVRHCIYAVDKNPLAVDLCKVALWIECHTMGLPLGFLDHHVKCGDSLVGVMDLDVLDEGIPDNAYKAVTGDDKKAAAWYRKRNKRERTTGQRSLALESSSMDTAVLAGDYETFGELEEHTADEVKTLEELYGDMRGPGTSWWQLKTACDLWTLRLFSLRSKPPDRVNRILYPPPTPSAECSIATTWVHNSKRIPYKHQEPTLTSTGLWSSPTCSRTAALT